MTDSPDRGGIGRPQQQRLASHVRRFEEAWQRVARGADAPDLQSYVLAADPADQATLRRLLLGVDRRYRESGGDTAGSAADPHDRTLTFSGTSAGLDPRRTGSDNETASESSDATVSPDVLPPGGNGDDTRAPSEEPGGPQETIDGAKAADAAATSGWSLHEAIDSRLSKERPSGEAPGEACDATFTLDGGHDQVRRPGSSAAAGVRVSGAMPEVPGYELLGELGRGGMGVVYRARQLGLNRTVALKMVLAGGHASADQLARFHAEAEAVAQLQHPNIVQVYDVGGRDGLPFFSLEFVDGKPLDKEIDGKPIVPERAANLVEQVSHAMHYAHQHGILHRDLKPQNILLTSAGVPKVTDFGLVKRIEGDGASQTQTGTIMGTPSYMPPEQGRGERELGPTADVYALGAVLYCLLTGRPPFAAPTPVDTLMQVLEDEPVPPSRLQPRTPPDLETICLKCLQKEPGKRYSTAEELAEDLRRFRAGEPILARPVGQVERACRWCRRNPRVAIPAAVAALFGLIILIGAPIATAIVWQQKEAAVAAETLAKKNETIALKSEEKAILAEQSAQRHAEIAKSNEAKAVQARTEAEENERKALKAEQLASQQNRLALDTLKKLVQEVQGELKNKPRMQELREALLVVAMERVDQVSPIGGSATSKDVTMAGAFRQMGDIYSEMGQSEKALQQYQQCHAIVEQLAKENRLPSKYHNLSFSLMNLGRAAKQSGQPELAMRYLLEALSVRRQWAEVESDNRYIPQNVAETLGWLGGLALSMGDLEQAQLYYEEARQLRQEWVEWDPSSHDAQQQLAGSDDAMAQVYLQRGQLDKAAQFMQQAIDSFESLSANRPENRTDQWNLALFRSRMGTIKLFAQKPAEAVQLYAEAIPDVQRLSEEDPQNAQLREHLATYQYGIATAYRMLGDPRAEAHFQESLRLRRELFADDPSNQATRGHLALSLARCGLHREAAEHIQYLRDLESPNAQRAFTAACGYALCSTAAQVDSALDEPVQNQLAKKYIQQALEMLQAAINQGYDRTATLAIEPDLEALHDEPEFQKLLSGVGGAKS